MSSESLAAGADSIDVFCFLLTFEDFILATSTSSIVIRADWAYALRCPLATNYDFALLLTATSPFTFSYWFSTASILPRIYAPRLF